MSDFLELLAKLLGIVEGFSFLMILAVLLGTTDDLLPRNKGWDWNGVFQAILFLGLQALATYLLAIGIVWFLSTQEQIHLDSWNAYLLYSWGFRIVALLCIWRSIWPRKQWTEYNPAPPYARLKLLGLALLAGALSFLPIA